MQSQGLKGSLILVIEDEGLLRKSILRFLEGMGAEVTGAASLEEAVNVLEAGDAFDFVLMDIHLPDGESLDLLRDGELNPSIGIVVMTAEGGVETAVKAMRLGAGDFLTKPFEIEELPLVFERLRRSRQHSRLESHRKAQASADQGGYFFGERLGALRSQLDRILETDHRLGSELPPILLQGETGTGKSSLARWIHENGPRASGPFVEVNCAALPENLAESELFGYEKGAFTDARTDRLGLFEAAEGGTLLLDEIAALSAPIQAKLLTAIETRNIRRVGGVRAIKVDVRLIAASLESLPEAVAQRRFREDLYHRLDLLTLSLPALREFPDDLDALCDFLLDRLRKRYRRKKISVSACGRRRVRAVSWPGNIRELSHELERALIFEQGDVLDLERLAPLAGFNSGDDTSVPVLKNPGWSLPEEGFELESALKELEADLIREALDQVDGNVSAAARRLGVNRDYIRYRVSE